MIVVLFSMIATFQVLAALTGSMAVVPLGSLVAAGIVGLLLARRGQSLETIGLGRRPGPASLPAGIVLAAAMLGVAFLFQKTLEVHFGLPDLSAFENLRGNVGLALWFLFIAWIPAAVGEELIFRGFIRQRLASAFAGRGKVGRGAELAALATQAVLFGLAHAYQGLAGVLVTALLGTLLGAGFLVFGRNLWVCIVAHGIVNSLSIAELYLDRRLF